MYDVECEHLARAFLRDTDNGLSEKNVAALATVIQEAIEEWLREKGIE